MKAWTLIAILAGTQLTGCFVFIPGSVVGKVTDAITGAEGEHCVSRQASIGSRITLPTGDVYEVKTLSGTSTRCTDERYPIRASLAYIGPSKISPIMPTPAISQEQAAKNAELALVERRRTLCRSYIRALARTDEEAKAKQAKEVESVGVDPSDCPSIVKY